ncbi:unnamed protein product [Clonostachys rhizophaga]|uniref:CHAT domain-containing protein n=1 Tax=Clonostachys rhizophaga TaxID=160324 RepID=A0A9N9YTH2_9HYPO|nr:unnamed protein product [Clonostachys rhizophaga]
MEAICNEDKISDILGEALEFQEEYNNKKYDEPENREGRLQDLKRSIELFQQVIAQTTKQDRCHLLGLGHLGESYLDMFNETGDPMHASESIAKHQVALELTPDDDIGLLGTLKQIDKAYHDRFMALKEAADRDSAIKYWEAFIASAESALEGGNAPKETGLFEPEWIGWLGFLGDLYYKQYLCHGSLDDLDRAIILMQKAAEQEQSKSAKGVRKLRLGVVYGNMHQETGSMEHLKECISLYEEAHSLLPSDHPDVPVLMKCLSTAYRDRSSKTGSIEDLDLSIQRIETSVGIPSGNDFDRAVRLGHLGTVHEDKFRQLNHLDDLKKSIQYKTEALDLVQKDGQQRAHMVSSLANSYATRFSGEGRERDLGYLDKSIELNHEALRLASTTDWSYICYNLGMNYHHRYEKFLGRSDTPELLEKIDMTDLNHSIQLKEHALRETPHKHPSLSTRLSGLGEGYELLYYISDEEMHWEKSLDCWEKALAYDYGSTGDRLEAGLYLMDNYICDHPPRWDEAYEAASKTMAIISLLTSPSLQSSDKLRLLERASVVGPQLAAIALNCGKPALEAVQHLEQGRGLISKFKNELRETETRLRETRPNLADKLAALRLQTEGPSQGQGNPRHEAGEKLEALRAEIGNIPGFTPGESALSEDDLRVAAERGPIIILNMTTFQCDALIVDKRGAKALPLLRGPPLEEYRRSDARRFEELERHAMHATLQSLEYIWKNIAQPVLHELGFTETPSDDNWPHVWWIPTGALSNFPIHAAGIYSQSLCDGVLDRVISSYTSTIYMLLRIRSRPCATFEEPSQKSVVLVAMEETPDHARLRFVSQEVAQLEKVFSDAKFLVSKPQPTHESVLAALGHWKIFHFAGHGESHHSQPMESKLLLKDWKSNPLTVSQLCETNLSSQAPFLAYLSACKTGHMHHGRGERLHIIGACQLAGFRHVIGTLWEVQDETSATVAVKTYEWMLKRGLDDRSVSEGLHHTIRDLRKGWTNSNRSTRNTMVPVRGIKSTQAQRTVKPESGRKPTPYWVPIIHFGV